MKLIARLCRLPVLIGLLLAGPLRAEELPPVPRVLLGHSAVACVKLSEGGGVASVYLAISTGTTEADGEILQWVRGLRWQAAFSSPPPVGWFAMPLAFGEGEPPLTPTTCGPRSASFT